MLSVKIFNTYFKFFQTTVYSQMLFRIYIYIYMCVCVCVCVCVCSYINKISLKVPSSTGPYPTSIV